MHVLYNLIPPFWREVNDTYREHSRTRVCFLFPSYTRNVFWVMVLQVRHHLHPVYFHEPHHRSSRGICFMLLHNWVERPGLWLFFCYCCLLLVIMDMSVKTVNRVHSLSASRVSSARQVSLKIGAWHYIMELEWPKFCSMIRPSRSKVLR